MLVTLKTLKHSTIASSRTFSDSEKERDRRRSRESKESLKRASSPPGAAARRRSRPPAFSCWMYAFSSAAVWNWRPPAFRSRVGTRVEASGIRMSMGTPEAMVQSGREAQVPGEQEGARRA